MLLAGCAALVVESYAALVHSGGTANDLLPAFLAAALLAALGMGEHPGGLVSQWADRLARGRIAGWRPGRSGRWVAAAAAALVTVQLATLVSGFRIGQALPTSADRAAGGRLTSGLRALGGMIAIPSDPGLDLMAGPAVAHQGATDDILRSSDPGTAANFTGSAARAVAARRFSAIVSQNGGPPEGFPADLARSYRRCPQMLLPGVPRAVFQPVAGARGRPGYAWLPLGRGSCAAAVRVLDGLTAASPMAGPSAAQPHRPARSGGSKA